MGHLLGGLGEQEAAAGIGAIEPAAGEVVEQRFVVELRVVAAEGKFEAVLAFGGAVAGAGGAAGLVEHGGDVAQERDGGLGRDGGDASEQQKWTHSRFSPRGRARAG